MKTHVTRLLSLLLALVLVGSMMPAAMAASYDGAGETEPSSSGDALADLPDPIEGYDHNDPDNPYPYGLPVTDVVPEDVLAFINSGISGFATMAADNQGNIPDEMWDNTILRALEYTGYDLQKQKDNGQLYQYKYIGSRLLQNDPDVLTNIGYWSSGSCPNGDETIDDPTTVTGKAPKLSYFESNGLVCASFVTYYLCNYLPNIEGVDRMPQMHIWGCLPVRVGERLNGIQEVSGSIPLISTNQQTARQKALRFCHIQRHSERIYTRVCQKGLAT